jgi:hypothetical protein
MANRKSKRFPGMKVNPDLRKKNGRRKGSKNTTQGKLKEKIDSPNSSKEDFRNESNLSTVEFLKVRANESQEEWEKRTRKKRIFGVSKTNKIKTARNGALVIQKRRPSGRVLNLKVRVLTQFKERPHNFLKNYAFVMRWASVRFKILKDDIELGYNLYETTPFTKDEFNYICIQLGSVRGVFNRFLNKGYITNISIISSEGNVKETEYFALSTQFNHVIKRVYGLISKTVPVALGETNHSNGKINAELKMEMERMNDEIREILSRENNKN